MKPKTLKEHLKKGWTITNENKQGTTIEKRKTFWWIMLLLFGIFYLIYYFATKNMKKTITNEEGETK